MVLKRFDELGEGDGPLIVPITTDQYHAMIGKGLFRDGDPIELIEGLLIYKDRSKIGERSPMHYPDHATGVSNLLPLNKLLEPLGCHLQSQLPVTIPQHDEPEPDGAVVRGKIKDYARRHPSPADVLAVIEVSSSSLDFDRTTKGQIYARAGIPVYWILNLVDRQVEVFEEPDSAEGRYRKQIDFGSGSILRLAIDDTIIDVAANELLPPTD
jgi:Uma2 family endonuclease